MSLSANFMFSAISMALLLSCSPSATSSHQKSEQLIGRLSHQQWSKSTESYCAGGSDYWRLEQADGNTVIKPANKQMAKEWMQDNGQSVKLWGTFRQVEKKANDNPNEISQRPVGDVFECTIFEVTKWERE